jgi:hypothetical protein
LQKGITNNYLNFFVKRLIINKIIKVQWVDFKLEILNIMDELKFRSLNIKLSQLCKQVKDNMCNSFLDFWNGERVDVIGSNRGFTQLT